MGKLAGMSLETASRRARIRIQRHHIDHAFGEAATAANASCRHHRAAADCFRMVALTPAHPHTLKDGVVEAATVKEAGVPREG